MPYTLAQWENDQLDAYLEGEDEEIERPTIFRCSYTSQWKHRDTGRFLSNTQALAIALDAPDIGYAVIKEIREDVAWDIKLREPLRKAVAA